MMLQICFFRTVFIVKNQGDFGKLSGSQNSYLAGSINLSMESPVTFENGFLDCVGHQISSSTQVFDAVSGAMIRNCAFRLATQFATTIDGTTLTNVTVVTSESGGCQTAITNSEFHGVKIYTSSQFAADTTGTLFVGCSLGILVEQSDKDQSFVGKITNCTVQNCFLNASISVNALVSVGGLAIRSSDLLILKSRFVSNITAVIIKNDSHYFRSLSGCVVAGLETLTITDSDFLSNMLVSKYTEYVGGILANFSSNYNLSFHNLSSYLSFLDNSGASCRYLGNVIANLKTKNVEFKELSTFNDIRILKSGAEHASIAFSLVSGVVANSLTNYMRITLCFASGTFLIDLDLDLSVNVAGCIAKGESALTSEIRLKNVCFNGEILVQYLIEKSDLMASGIVSDGVGIYIDHSQVYGNISATISNYFEFTVAAVLATSAYKGVIESCFAAANITVTLADSISYSFIGCLAAMALTIYNSFVVCNLTLAQTDYGDGQVVVGMLSAFPKWRAENCSAEGDMFFKTTSLQPMQGIVGGLAGRVENGLSLYNLTVRGSITAPGGFYGIGTLAGKLEQAEIANVLVAVDLLMPGANAQVCYNGISASKVLNLLVDCGRKGNAAGQKYCRSDLTTENALSSLSAAFSWNAAYNGGYPYPNMIPVMDASHKYVLPDSGNFSAGDYYIDDAGFPFPKIDFQPCRGVCYGVYSSPVIRTCDDAFEYCIDVDRAAREFPGDSCIADNAVCSSGASFCSSEAEMLLLKSESESESEYACQNTCSGCYNGYCSYSKCVCDIYNEGDACTHNCRADEPNCFGNDSIVCDMQNASCIPTPSCDDMACVHGKCSDLPIAHCECDGLWIGDLCDRCKAGFDPIDNCEQCEKAMQVIDGACACGYAGVVCEDDYFCYSGSCQKGCMLLGKNCASCDRNQRDLCGSCVDGFVLKKKVCLTPLKAAAAAIIGGAVGGCAVLVAIGVAVFFVLRSKKAGGEHSPYNYIYKRLFKDKQMKPVQMAANDRDQPFGAPQQAFVGGTDIL